MKLGVLLNGLKKIIHNWGVFLILGGTLTYLTMNGIVFQKEAIESELEPYVTYFKDAAIQYHSFPDFSNLTGRLVDRFPVSNWVGLCQSFVGSSSKSLTIRSDYFKKAPAEIKYALVIHELGHCTLGLRHIEGYRSDGCPISIMHPSDSMLGCFFTHQDYYLKELFGSL